VPDINPLIPGPADFLFGVFALFPIVFGLVFLAVAAVFVFVIYRLVKDRKKISAYNDAMYRLPGEIIKATQAGDLAKAQLLQNQLLLMQQHQQASRAPMAPGFAAPGFPLGAPMPPSGVPGDINGDGIPGN